MHSFGLRSQIALVDQIFSQQSSSLTWSLQMSLHLPENFRYQRNHLVSYQKEQFFSRFEVGWPDIQAMQYFSRTLSFCSAFLHWLRNVHIKISTDTDGRNLFSVTETLDCTLGYNFASGFPCQGGWAYKKYEITTISCVEKSLYETLMRLIHWLFHGWHTMEFQWNFTS